MQKLTEFLGQYQKAIVFLITAISLYLVFDSSIIWDQTGLGNLLCGGPLSSFMDDSLYNCQYYFRAYFLESISLVAMVLFVTGLVIFNAFQRTFIKWLFLSAIFLIVEVVMIFLSKAHFYGLGIESWIISGIVYVLLIFVIFVYDTLKLRKQSETAVGGAPSIWFKVMKWFLVLDIAAIVIPGFFALFFLIVSPIFLGLPVLLFAGSAYLVNAKNLGKEKMPIRILLGIISLTIIAEVLFIVLSTNFHGFGW